MSLPPLQLAVIPVLMGPLQILLAALPAILAALVSLVAALARPRVLLQLLKFVWRQKLVVILVIGALLGVRHLRGMAAGKATEPDAVHGEWAETRGGPGRQGRTPGQAGPSLAGGIWSALDDTGESFLSSPAIAGEHVYIASAKLGVFNSSGALYCLDRSSGKVLWSAAPDGYEPTFSSPVIHDGLLVCGEGLHKTRHARLVCLDLADGGALLWTLQTKSHVECTPVIAGDRVVVGAGDDGYYCVSLRGSTDGKPELLWHLPGSRYPDAETSLAVLNDRVYAGLGVGGQAVCIFDLQTGEELKRLVTPFPVFTPPSFTDQSLVIGMGNGNLVEPASEIRAREVGRLKRAGASAEEIRETTAQLRDGGELWCLSTEDLSPRWKYTCDSTVLSAACVTEDRIIFVTRAGTVTSLDLEGKLIAAHSLGEPVLSAPAVDDERVYILSAAGRLHTLGMRDLAPLWSQQLDAGVVNTSSPVLDSGRLYVGTEKSGILCIGSLAETREAIWPGGLGGPGAAGNPMRNGIGAAGDFWWNFPSSRQGGAGPARVVAPPAVLDGRIYVPFAVGTPGVTCLDPSATPEAPPAVAWHADARHGVRITPAVTTDHVFFIETDDAGNASTAHAVSSGSGEHLWSSKLDATALSLVANREWLLVGSAQGTVSCLNHAGQTVWHAAPGKLTGLPCLVEQIALLATSDPAALHAIDLPSGRILWRRDLEAEPATGPVVRHMEVWLRSAKALWVFDLRDGLPVTGRQPGDARPGLGIRPRPWAGLPTLPNSVPMPMADGEVCLWTTTGITVVTPGSDTSSLWCETDWLGTPATPLVAGDGVLYAGVPGWGLVCFGEAQPR